MLTMHALLRTAVLLGALVLPALSHTAPLTTTTTQQADRDALCRDIGQLAFHAAVLRNLGTLPSEHLALLARVPAPNPHIAAYMRQVILNVHRMTWETPPVAQHRVETTCLLAQTP